ncbi:hypothetical protein HPB49_019203 [Dermacentor silvarum]|uniref:Uncharacterized protein n=1 Tax=Dermacentor silvarum TaxID=543639 RepID=A0ACB8CZC0_DERSI|nr:hypothetical protein HPB49_019203 [Dermacentor silvarum]
MARKKFHTKNTFGAKKVRRALINNFKKRSATHPDVEVVASPSEPASADTADVGLGLTSPSPCEGVEGHVRHDTKFLKPAEVEESKKRTKEKLQQLSSTPATERKRYLLTDNTDAAAEPVEPLDGTVFTIVSLDAVNILLARMNCNECSGGDMKIIRGEHEYGLSVKLILMCGNCDDVTSTWSSPRIRGEQKSNPFVVNVLAARAMQATGNRQTALNDVFSTMNISRRGLHTKTWQRYVKEKLTPAADRAARKVTSECARSVRKLYSELCLNNPGNITVSYDGSWMTRGHTSHIGVGAVIELFTGLCLDYVVLSNFCAGCETGPNENDPSFGNWKKNHQCPKNTEKKSGEMEVEATLILFKRSLERHNLRYTTILSDGDSRTYLALQEEKVYGYLQIDKEDCVNHVQKRMGTALRNLVSKSKASGLQSLGGKGRLTADLITRLSSYYGWALKTHKGDVDAMHKAVMATYYHITSNDFDSNHTFCPTGPNSWCRQNAAEARGEPAPKHPRNLPPHVCQALLPIYERLSEKKLLERCQRGKTQNSNESLHSVIWSLAPKDRHASLFTVQAAVAEAVLKFNAGNVKASASIMQELSLNPSSFCSDRMAEKDQRRLKASAQKRASAENMHQALKKRHTGNNSQNDYVPGGY